MPDFTGARAVDAFSVGGCKSVRVCAGEGGTVPYSDLSSLVLRLESPLLFAPAAAAFAPTLPVAAPPTPLLSRCTLAGRSHTRRRPVGARSWPLHSRCRDCLIFGIQGVSNTGELGGGDR